MGGRLARQQTQLEEHEPEGQHIHAPGLEGQHIHAPKIEPIEPEALSKSLPNSPALKACELQHSSSFARASKARFSARKVPSLDFVSLHQPAVASETQNFFQRCTQSPQPQEQEVCSPVRVDCFDLMLRGEHRVDGKPSDTRSLYEERVRLHVLSLCPSSIQ